MSNRWLRHGQSPGALRPLQAPLYGLRWSPAQQPESGRVGLGGRARKDFRVETNEVLKASAQTVEPTKPSQTRRYAWLAVRIWTGWTPLDTDPRSFTNARGYCDLDGLDSRLHFIPYLAPALTPCHTQPESGIGLCCKHFLPHTPSIIFSTEVRHRLYAKTA